MVKAGISSAAREIRRQWRPLRPSLTRQLGTDARICKFGGSSVAGSAQVKEVISLLNADPARRFAVVSAPGKRDGADTKVTDLLYHAHHLAARPGASRSEFDTFFEDSVCGRYREIVDELGSVGSTSALEADLQSAKAKIYDLARQGEPPDFAASRGEALNGQLFAALLGWEFIDPAAGDFIQFGAEGLNAPATASSVQARLNGVERAVVPGFYGSSTANVAGVQTFSRGGSDISGSIVAAGVADGGAYGTTVYENWTDVNGVYSADPRIVPNARSLAYLTFSELALLASAVRLRADPCVPCCPPLRILCCFGRVLTCCTQMQ